MSEASLREGRRGWRAAGRDSDFNFLVILVISKRKWERPRDLRASGSAAAVARRAFIGLRGSRERIALERKNAQVLPHESACVKKIADPQGVKEFSRLWRRSGA
jgi:hypothetical protein